MDVWKKVLNINYKSVTGPESVTLGGAVVCDIEEDDVVMEKESIDVVFPSSDPSYPFTSPLRRRMLYSFLSNLRTNQKP